MKSIIPKSELLLDELNINPSAIKFIKPRWKRSYHRAIINWLTRYQSELRATNLEKIKGLLEAFFHLCELEDWRKAKKILLIPLNTTTKDTLRDQLSVWGYYTEQKQLYSELYNKLDKTTDADCLLYLGNANHSLNNYNKACEYYKESLKLFQELKKYREIAWLRHKLGLLEADQGEDENARIYYETALKQFREIEDYKGVASILNDLARVETNQGNYIKAREYYEESLSIHVEVLKMEDKKGCAWIYYNYGRFLADQEEYARAGEYTIKSLAIFRETEYELGIPWALYSLGIVRLNLGQVTLAYFHTKKALKLFSKQKNKGGIAWGSHIMGRIALKNKDYALATECYQKKLKIHLDEQNKTGITFALEGFAHIAAIRKQYARAARLLGAAQSLREEIKFPLPPSDRLEHKQIITTIHSQLDRATLTEIWESGREISIEQIIDEVLVDNE